MKFFYGVAGQIISSSKPHHMVRVEDDSANTGGFFIYEWWTGSNGPNVNDAFNSWVESTEDLALFLKESGWIIQWPDEVPSSSAALDLNDETGNSMGAGASKLFSSLLAACGGLIGVTTLWMAVEGIAAQGMFLTCKKVLTCWVSASETPGPFWVNVALLSLMGICLSGYCVFFVYMYLKMRFSRNEALLDHRS
jgi:hypothetical protein